jgi:hypothetical protein
MADDKFGWNSGDITITPPTEDDSVSLYNENHADDGRFTSGGSSGGTSKDNAAKTGSTKDRARKAEARVTHAEDQEHAARKDMMRLQENVGPAAPERKAAETRHAEAERNLLQAHGENVAAAKAALHEAQQANPQGSVDHTTPKSVSSPAASHNVPLPKNPKRLNIDQAESALGQMGYKLGKSNFDAKLLKTTYEVTHPDGKSEHMTTDALKKLIYSRAAGGKGGK